MKAFLQHRYSHFIYYPTPQVNAQVSVQVSTALYDKLLIIKNCCEFIYTLYQSYHSYEECGLAF